MLPTLRTFEYNYSTHQRISQSYHKTSTQTLHKYSIFVQTVLPAHVPTQTHSKIKKNLTVHNLVGHHGSFFHILTELLIRTVRFGSLPKCVQTSRWPVRLHQPEYETHVLAGGCGDIPLEGLGYFMKSPR